MSSIHPSQQQFRALMALEPGHKGPVSMLNLLRFREQASYLPEHNEQPCSGREAYQRYGEVVGPYLERVGGRPIWVASALLSVIAPADETWDEALVVEYPSLSAFVRMMTDEGYLAITHHRDAALADSRLIAMATQALDIK